MGVESQAQGVLHKVSISNGADDADEKDGIVEVYDLELDMGWEQGTMSTTALYFRDVHLEAGAQVSSIALQLTTQQALEDTISLRIRVEDNAFPAPLTDTISLVAARSFLVDEVIWEIPPAEQNTKRQSPELLDLIQPLLSSTAWEAASGLYLVLEPADPAPDSASLEYQCYSYDQLDSTRRPTLRIFVDSNDINGIMAPVQNGFKVYPNPSHGQIRLHSTLQEDESFSLYTSDGRLVRQFTKPIAISVMDIDLGQLQTGVYVLLSQTTGARKRILLY